MTPPGYGYSSVEGADEAEIERLHDQVRAHADGAGRAPADTHVDRHPPPRRVARPGPDLLPGQAGRAGGCALLVPAPVHSSLAPQVRRARESKAGDLGGRVLAAATATTACPEPAAGAGNNAQGRGMPGAVVEPRPPPP